MAIAIAMPDIGMGLEALAQWYAATFGWEVFPCRGKRPAFPTAHPDGHPCRGECGELGHGFYDASADAAKIAMMWSKAPNANIGWRIPDQMVVIDADARHKGVKALADLQAANQALPQTVTSMTGSGQGSNHRLFRIPKDHAVSSKLGPGIDVKSRGGYLILPYSVHPDTYDPYRWADQHVPGEVAIADAPGWLLDLLKHGPPVEAKSEHGVPLDPNAVIPIGDRNNTLFAIAQHYSEMGLDFDDAWELLQKKNKQCQKPLSERELKNTLRSAFNRAIVVNITPSGSPRTQSTPSWDTDKRLTFTDVADMLERTYPTPRWLIKDLIPEGLVFFAGSPKSSKTYLAYSLALSLVLDTLEDEPWLGQYPILNPGPVVYFTLEDDEGDSWMRIKELMPGLTTMDRNRFVFHHGYDLPPLGPDFVSVLKDQVIATYAPSLIVLDPLSYLYPPTMKGVDQFGEVKNMLLPMRWLGKEHHCTILGIDHRRKKSADDVDIFETTYGSNAKPAIADSMLMVIREAEEVTLHARVRKAADQTLTLAFTFDAEGRAHWEWKGAVDGLLGQGKYGELRFKVLEALSGYGGPMSTSDILAALDIPESIQMKANLRKVLWRAEQDGEVQKTKRGSYVWAGGR